jgi:hypothetical protein
MNGLIEQWKREIERDLEYFRKTINQPTLTRSDYEYGDGTGERGCFSVWTLACPNCLYRGEVMTAEKSMCPQCGNRMMVYTL